MRYVPCAAITKICGHQMDWVLSLSLSLACVQKRKMLGRLPRSLYIYKVVKVSRHSFEDV